MSQFFETACRPDTAAGAIAQHLRVKTPGAVALAGVSDASFGTMDQPCLAAGPCTIRLANAPGTRKMIASEAITKGNPVYAAANGRVAASGTVFEGRAMETVTTAGDVIEVLPLHNSDIGTSISGTTAAGFEVDSDSATPKIKLLGSAGGTGDFTTILTTESTLSADNTIIVPEADGDTLAAVALAQTLTNKTLTAPSLTGLTKLQNTVTPVAAAGSSVSDAAALAATTFNHITSDLAAKGVKLPTTAASQFGYVINNSSTAAEFYAASGGTVNGLSADASVVIPASKGLFWFATAANTIIAFDLPAKATAS